MTIRQVLNLENITKYPITNLLKGGLYGYFKKDQDKKWYLIAGAAEKNGKELYKTIPLVLGRKLFIKYDRNYTKEELLNEMVILSAQDKNDSIKILKMVIDETK